MSLYYTGTQRVECVCYPLSLRSKKMWKLCFGISKKGYLFSSMVSFFLDGIFQFQWQQICRRVSKNTVSLSLYKITRTQNLLLLLFIYGFKMKGPESGTIAFVFGLFDTRVAFKHSWNKEIFSIGGFPFVSVSRYNPRSFMCNYLKH